MSGHSWRLTAGVAVITTLGRIAFGQPATVNATSSSTWPVSPSAVATVLIQNQHVELIVVWRGEPRWYLGGSGNSDRSSVQGTIATGSARMGRGQLNYAYDYSRRIAWIESTEVRLETGEDVILVDDIASPSGPKVVGRIKASLGRLGPDDIGAALQSSADVMTFMQCDLPNRDAGFNGGSGCGSLPIAPFSSSMRTADLAGRWNLELNPGFSGNQETFQCTIAQDNSKLSLQCGDQTIAGDVNGPAITWRFTTGPNGSVTVMFNGLLNGRGQSMSGFWRLVGGGPSRTGRFTATRLP